MTSYRIIKSMMDTVQPQDRRRILSFIVQEHPRTPEVMTRCSELMEEERELARLALVLGGELVRQQEALARLRAATVFQATWRAVLTRRKFKVMLKGFQKLQKLYRDQSSSVTFPVHIQTPRIDVLLQSSSDIVTILPIPDSKSRF